MKPSDRIILDTLRKCGCEDVSQTHWEMVEDAVEKAGDIRNVTGYASTVLFNAIEKARFSSRSEAGRYAANMRWKGQGERTAGTSGGKGQPSQADIAGMSQRNFDQDELRVYIDEQEGLLQVMQDLGESRDKISQQERIISQAKQDLEPDQEFGTRTAEDFTPSEVRDDEEAQIKQDFIDAQKERLGNMGRGTSQSAYMALESGIKRLEAELASGDTSEARNRPGQFFDDREGSKGDKYIGYRPNKEVAADIRRDLKSAVENGKLPEGLKFSVKMDARGRAIRVRVTGVQNARVIDDLGREVRTPEAKAIYDKVDEITNAYNRYNSDPQTDYFDVDYYGFVNIDD